jgi:hypothetical protein
VEQEVVGEEEGEVEPLTEVKKQRQLGEKVVKGSKGEGSAWKGEEEGEVPCQDMEETFLA